jgi:hypothetical protein
MSDIVVIAVVTFCAVGTVSAGVLWDQSAPDPAVGPALDQEFTDFPEFSVYQVNDVTTGPAGWLVDAISTYFTQQNGDWTRITQARLNVFPKSGEKPDWDDWPTLGTLVPITVAEISPTTWQATAANLDLTLPGGSYWIALTPIGAYADVGAAYHRVAASLLGDQAAYWEALYAEGWHGLSALYGQPVDTAFKIEGTIIPEPTGLLLLGSAAALCRRCRPSLTRRGGDGIAAR